MELVLLGVLLGAVLLAGYLVGLHDRSDDPPAD